MVTAFDDIILFIRAAVLDLDCSKPIYAKNALVSQIRFQLALGNASPYNTDDPTFLLAENGTSQFFTTLLTAQQKTVLALRCAVRLMAGRPDEFSYKTPVLSVARKGQARMLQMDLQDALDTVLGGRFAITTDDEFGALIQAYNRFVNELNSGIFAWPGTPDGLLQSEM